MPIKIEERLRITGQRILIGLDITKMIDITTQRKYNITEDIEVTT